MKAHYLKSRSEQRRMAHEVAKEEIEKQKAEICPACEERIGNQVLAVVCKALQVRYGFGKQRLQTIVQDTENLFSLCAVDGKRYNAMQAVEWLKSIGIDLEDYGGNKNGSSK